MNAETARYEKALKQQLCCAGGTVSLTGTLRYLSIFNPTTFAMSMTCDVNGNISYWHSTLFSPKPPGGDKHSQ